MADEKTQIIGVWKLVSVMYEDQETKAMTPIMGDHPRGYQIATPDGRWLALATPSGRTAPETDAERAQAFRTMIGYSGRYRVDGSTITTKVDVAWNESWVGGEQVRFTHFAGEHLVLTQKPRLWQGVMQHRELHWERIADAPAN